MIKFIKNQSLKVSAIAVLGVLSGVDKAHAAPPAGQDFTSISDNIVGSISGLPGLLTGVSYMFGILLGVLGILKIKDHVENPSNAPLKDGAIRLIAGGGLFALPIVFEAMQTSVGAGAGPADITVDRVGSTYTLN